MQRINACTVKIIVKIKRRCQSLSDDCLGHGDGVGEWPKGLFPGTMALIGRILPHSGMSLMPCLANPLKSFFYESALFTS